MPQWELDRAIASDLADDGLRHLTMTADWNTPNGTANGGYVLAILARAVLDHADAAGIAHPDLLTVSVNYLKPPVPGPSAVAVETIRVGRRVSVHTASLQQNETVVAHGVIAIHDWDATGEVEHVLTSAPKVVGPEESQDLMGVVEPGTIPIADRYVVRHPAGGGWLEGKPTGTAEALVWMRPEDGRPIDAIAAAAIVDAYPPVTAELGEFASSTVQLTVHLRRRPETDWALLHVTTSHVSASYHDEDVELWDERGRLIAQCRQLAILS